VGKLALFFGADDFGGVTVKPIWAETLTEVRYALLGEGKQTFSKQY